MSRILVQLRLKYSAAKIKKSKILKMHLGTRLKAAMKEAGVSNMEMANHVGVTAGAVSNWFSSGKISKESLIKFAAKVNRPVDELWTGEQSNSGKTLIQTTEGQARTVSQAVSLLAQFLLEADELTRAQIAPLLQALTADPRKGDDIAGRIEDALGSQARNRFKPEKKAA